MSDRGPEEVTLRPHGMRSLTIVYRYFIISRINICGARMAVRQLLSGDWAISITESFAKGVTR